MKKLIVGLTVLALIPIVYLTGCTRQFGVPSGPMAPTATPTLTATVTRTSTATRTVTTTLTRTSTPTITSTPTQTGTPTTTPTAQATQAAVVLGRASNFAVLAGTTITNSGPTSLCGDLGLSPGSAVVGAPVLTCSGVYHVTDAAAADAQFDLGVAYLDAYNRTNPVLVAGNLGGQTLYPGLYKSTGSLAISSGDLTLDGQGDVNSVFIFQIASTLITTPGRQVILSGGAQAANVFWQVGTYCALDTTTSFKGIIMAYGAITFNTGAVLEGRAFSEVDQVTFLSNTITNP